VLLLEQAPPSVITHHHIGGIHIQMQHPLSMQVLQRPCHLQANLHGKKFFLHPIIDGSVIIKERLRRYQWHARHQEDLWARGKIERQDMAM
jgi:hypothetical protein